MPLIERIFKYGGLGIGVISLVANPWLLGYIVSPDHTISSLPVNVAIMIFQIVGVWLGVQLFYFPTQSLGLWKAQWKNIALFLAMYIVMEFFVMLSGIFLPSPNADRDQFFLDFSVPHGTLGYIMKPNLHDYVQQWRDGGVTGVYDTDEHGFRNAGLNDATSSLFFIGDSFTFGSWVPRENTFYARIGAALEKSAVTYGVGGYGLSQYLVVARDVVPSTTIKKTVFINLFANDLEAPYPEEKLSTLYEDVFVPQTRRIPFWSRLHPRYTATSGVIRLLFDKPPTDRLANGMTLFANRGASQTFLSEDREAFEKILRNIMGILRHRSDVEKIFLVLIPSKESVYDDEYRDAFGDSYLDNERQGFELASVIAKEYDVPVLDLTEIFRHNKAEKHYFDLDPHWNPYGHALAADSIFKWLKTLNAKR